MHRFKYLPYCFLPITQLLSNVSTNQPSLSSNFLFSTAQETAGQTLTRICPSSPWPLKPTLPPPAPHLGPLLPPLAPRFKRPTSPSKQLDLMPTQVCGPSAGATCETQEFTTLKSLGKYRRSLHTRSRVSRRWQCCQLSFFSRLSFFLCKLHAHSSICKLVFLFIPVFLLVLMGDGWSRTEPLASSLSVISVFLSPSRSQFQTHIHTQTNNSPSPDLFPSEFTL